MVHVPKVFRLAKHVDLQNIDTKLQIENMMGMIVGHSNVCGDFFRYIGDFRNVKKLVTDIFN